MKSKVIKKLISLKYWWAFCLLLLSFHLVNAQPTKNVTLGWDYDFLNNSNVTGFNIYQGVVNEKYYTNFINVTGHVTQVTFDNLNVGVNYKFVMTAKDTNNLEGDFSSEISFFNSTNFNPTNVTQFFLQITKSELGIPRIKTTLAPFQNIKIQYTSDFRTWNTLIETNGDSSGNVTYDDITIPIGQNRFYRAITF